MGTNKKGFTIVEVLVAMALLSLAAVAFIALMSFSVSSIFLAGEKSEKIFDAQGEIESEISAQLPSGDDEVKINFPDEVADDLTITGEKLEITYEYNGGSSSIIYFLPIKGE